MEGKKEEEKENKVGRLNNLPPQITEENDQIKKKGRRGKNTYKKFETKYHMQKKNPPQDL